VWVPTEDGREALVEAGVDREKVVAIPAPVDARLFAPCPRAVVEGPFTVVAEVDWISGGGFESILRAWVEEFEAGDPVRLLLCGPDGRGDAAARVLGLLDDLGQDPEAIPDVELLLEPLAPAALAETYRGADAAVVVAGGDPAGLRAARATACGLTVVTAAPGASCLREELRRAFEGRPSGAPTARCEHSLADAADAVDARLVRLLG
jgi:hypothetical protein